MIRNTPENVHIGTVCMAHENHQLGLCLHRGVYRVHHTIARMHTYTPSANRIVMKNNRIVSCRDETPLLVLMNFEMKQQDNTKPLSVCINLGQRVNNWCAIHVV
mmetsp:Transcript_114842/g.199779  ORF Transcript_114842/g.199779 Transcript_114842/m.199779 type:complete len:104 (+) Transcript_114842:981-1292(+)